MIKLKLFLGPKNISLYLKKAQNFAKNYIKNKLDRNRNNVKYFSYQKQEDFPVLLQLKVLNTLGEIKVFNFFSLLYPID